MKRNIVHLHGIVDHFGPVTVQCGAPITSTMLRLPATAVGLSWLRLNRPYTACPRCLDVLGPLTILESLDI